MPRLHWTPGEPRRYIQRYPSSQGRDFTDVLDTTDMRDENHHAACVDGWLKRAPVSPEARLQLFEAAMGALWARTTTTLGEVTLTAIADRVLHNASEKFPHFSSLKIESPGGFQFGEFRERITSIPASELSAGIRFVLVEFLTVLGNLTAEILTPELHAELSHIAPKGSRREGKKS